MSDIAIRAEGLGKLYRLGAGDAGYKTVRESLTRAITAPLHPFRRGVAPKKPELLWALKDVSFEVKHGDVVGIIGRNGAGKSTLLKILSRITEPSSGRAEIHGRVGSLLEVGTGFHPELTGRENIYLNGAILGMKNAEIQRKFDEIVAFAEVEKFIDTPVKHYSSGMYVRLAFAVAAHLEPEILVVDEVLAVGDAAFQTKCLGKLGDVAKGGRTVLLVSHSMASISSLCTSGLLLGDGKITKSGEIDNVIDSYLTGFEQAGTTVDFVRSDKARTPRFACASIINDTGRPSSVFNNGDNIYVDLFLDSEASADLLCAVLVRTSTGIPVLHLTSHEAGRSRYFTIRGRTHIRCTLANCQLFPGRYTVSLWIGRSAHHELEMKKDVLSFLMEQGPLMRLGFDLTWRHGLVHAENTWDIVQHEAVAHAAPGQEA